VKEASRAIDRVAADVAVGGDLEHLVVRTESAPREPVRASDLRKGMKVYVPRLRAEAEIVDVLSDGGVRVAAGPLKLVVAASELRAAEHEAPPPPPPRAKKSAYVESDIAIPTRDNSCDLRGLRVDDAVAMATSALDRALTDGRRFVYLIHGHGTGALRDAIRKELRGSRYVAALRPGTSDEGGDGVTVVRLA
jgi:DNA mismatch repair protein MutS2